MAIGEAISWSWRGNSMAGLFVPALTEAAPLVTYLRGGPEPRLDNLEAELGQWVDQRWSVFVPLVPSSGVVGEDARREAEEARRSRAEDDLDLQSTLAGIDSLVETYGLERSPLAIVGFSHGAYLVNRAVTMTTRFKAAVCVEGVADVRTLDDASLELQSRWLGGSPSDVPERWAAASPITRALEVQTPMLLIYGDAGSLTAQGRGWRDALTCAGTTVLYEELCGQGHVFDESGRAKCRSASSNWFAQHLL